jgi:hypothetical protein
LPVQDLMLTSAVFMPVGGSVARAFEPLVLGWLPLGSLLVAAGNILFENHAIHA